MSGGGSGRRRRGRELALRVLFELEGTDKDPTEVLDYQAEDLGAAPDVKKFATQIVQGCIERGDAIDEAIQVSAEHWPFDDLGKVERAVLRIGAWELLFADDAPVAVVIDESVELAKTFGGDPAGPFVNGVLGDVARRHEGSA